MLFIFFIRVPSPFIVLSSEKYHWPSLTVSPPPLYSQLSSFLFFFYFLFSILRRVFLHLLFSNRHLHFSDFIIIVVVVHVIIILHPLIGIITPVYCGLQPRDRAVPYRAMRYVMKFTFGTWSFPTRKKTVA